MDVCVCRHDCPGLMRMNGRCFWSCPSPSHVTRSRPTRMHRCLSRCLSTTARKYITVFVSVSLPAIRQRPWSWRIVAERTYTLSVPWLTLLSTLLFLFCCCRKIWPWSPGWGIIECVCNDCVSTFDNSVSSFSHFFVYFFFLSLIPPSPIPPSLPYSTLPLSSHSLFHFLFVAFLLQSGAELEYNW